MAQELTTVSGVDWHPNSAKLVDGEPADDGINTSIEQGNNAVTFPNSQRTKSVRQTTAQGGV